MTQIRAMDAAFLAMERPAEPRHLGSVSIFGPGAAGPLTYDVVRALLEERLPLIRSTRRVVVGAPLGLGRPSWGPSTGFDLEFHLRHDAVAPPGGPAELAELVARAHALPLDRSRPLWELWVIDGLPDGRVALYAKIHMAALDDVTGAEVMTALLDPDVAGERHVQPEPPVAAPNVVGRLFGGSTDQLRRAAGFPGRVATRAASELGDQLAVLGETIVETVHRTPGLDGIARLLPTPTDGDVVDARPAGRAPRVSWNEPVTPHRRVATTRLPLERVVEIKRAAGTTVNDVVVAVCAGALREWLADHHELPSEPIVAMVPMLVGGTAHDDAHVAGLVVPLPTNVAAPDERLRRTREALTVAKQRLVAVPASLMQDLSMFAPPALSALAGRLVGAMPYRALASPTVNLAITNVPGSRQQLYLAGRPLEASHPILTINGLSPLHIGLQSSHESIDVGAVACRDTLQDLAELVEQLPVELDLLPRRHGRPGTGVGAPQADHVLEGALDAARGPSREDAMNTRDVKGQPQVAAIFDLDRTLIGGPSAPIFSHSLDAAGITQRRIPGAAAVAATYRALGETAITATTARVAARATAGWSCDLVRQAAEAAADELMTMVQPYATGVIEEHREAGRTLAMATTSPAPLVTAFAERLGMDAVIATEWATRDGQFTGELDGAIVWGRGKLDAVRAWADAEQVDLRSSYAYSDSYYDAPLLDAVRYPVAVNPDLRLAALARLRGWPIRHLDLPEGVPKIAGRELQQWTRFLQRPELLPNVRLDIAGVERIHREGPAIVVFNHRSYLDGTVVGAVLGPTGRSFRFLGKKEVFDAPVIGAFARMAGGIRVNRSSGSDEPLEAAIKVLQAGEVIVVAPEGTIPRGPAFFATELRGRWGAARLAAATHAPVIPVGLWGTEKVWPRNSRLPRLSTTEIPEVRVRVGEPVDLRYRSPDADTKRIMAALLDLLPDEARVERVPTAEELAATYPPGYRGDPTLEDVRRPGTDTSRSTERSR